MIINEYICLTNRYFIYCVQFPNGDCQQTDWPLITLNESLCSGTTIIRSAILEQLLWSDLYQSEIIYSL
jgi:hypothetical protein